MAAEKTVLKQVAAKESSMCLGIPGEILEIREDNGLRVGKVRFAGITREVCLEYVPEAARGDFVVVHVGFAISKIDAEEAERAYRVLEELGQTGELTADAPGPESGREIPRRIP